ncbi:isocitrate lyase/phosphoenolpyruvate mutase family protein [Gallaecimonas kandeliae]|uniref:isocitrate lyase/PEP mutase family protein n=1 Tax=Gallaecimonas kandeliae TaxID=3029055 RepID=UPI00264819CD|nr:isocitrate lyase/phosphoenolpyruvate mutase family protein [Gallaecimonas kandeliae]WKE66670.1 isocitrate lyase/phosphoenolpyruvate mutase family protein [Gallaecimonas kandeliae]
MTAKAFTALHRQASPLLICNVWDVASAKTAEQLNFGAIARMLGYRDGEQIPFEEMRYVAQRIAANCSLPFSVDMEAGYGADPLVTAAHVRALAEAGVVGINIEDSKVGTARALVDAVRFAGFLSVLKGQLAKDGVEIFINVRTDPFLLGQSDALAETLKRARLYEEAGADGLFAPCITQAADIEALVQATSLPVNVLAMPELPDFDTLARLGVKRISMGNWLFDKLQEYLATQLNQIRQANSFAPLFTA